MGVELTHAITIRHRQKSPPYILHPHRGVHLDPGNTHYPWGALLDASRQSLWLWRFLRGRGRQRLLPAAVRRVVGKL